MRLNRETDSSQPQPGARVEQPPLRVFVSPPGDVAAEREASKAVVRDLNDTCRAATGRHLEAVIWEEHGRPGSGVDVQDVLNEDMAEVAQGRYAAAGRGHSLRVARGNASTSASSPDRAARWLSAFGDDGHDRKCRLRQ